MEIHRRGFRVVSCLQMEGGGRNFNRHTAEIRRANKMVWEKITPPELCIRRPTEQTPNIGETFSMKWHKILAPLSLVWGGGGGPCYTYFSGTKLYVKCKGGGDQVLLCIEWRYASQRYTFEDNLLPIEYSYVDSNTRYRPCCLYRLLFPKLFGTFSPFCLREVSWRFLGFP